MALPLAVTPGEPAGIGPDLLIKLIQEGSPHELIAFADPEMLAARAELLKLPVKLRPACGRPLAAGELAVAPVPMATACTAGIAATDNAGYVLNCLRIAIDSCLDGSCRALVTGPVNKAVINDAGFAFSGHTEFLAERTGTSRVVMMLATEQLRVALVTTHLPLARVAGAITRPLLQEVIEILHRDLQHRFGIARPRILVAGLNPHAGEGGHLGREEIEIIEPVLGTLRRTGMDLIGPLPADTLFTPVHLAGADAVLAMYHDQGLPVLKYQGFGRAVNITLGLPLIRTSVDHGTALDLAGTGRGDTGSLATAIGYAARLAGENS